MHNDPSLHDTEFLLGLVVIAICTAAFVSALMFVCRRCCAAEPPANLYTVPRYVAVSDKHAVDVRRYVLEPNARVPTKCTKCGTNPITTIFTDCGHSMACPSCAHAIWKAERQCPLCHRPLDGVLHIIEHCNVSTARVEALVG
jgi:hypothetical protein